MSLGPAAAACASEALLGHPQAQEGRRPNILLFIVDDMGWQDTSVPLHTARTPLNDRYRTPAMERLAWEGMRFIDAHSASPVCTPTRVSILTGQNPCRHRVTNWTLYPDRETSADHRSLLPPEWERAGLQAGAVTLPGLLREAGYRTIHIGKAHFGAVGTTGSDPRALGFDVNIAGHAAGGPGSYWGDRNYSASWRGGDAVWDVPGLEAYHGTDTFLTEALTLEALRAMDEAIASDVPFYLYMAHYAVHAPIEADPRYADHYAHLDAIEAAYASLVEGMDASLGSLLANLDRHDIAGDTVVIFMSDNGGLSAHGRGGEPHTHNAPLRSGKGSAFEGGTRVPLLVRWPGAVRPYSVCGVPVISDDVFPTVLSMAGVPVPSQYAPLVDGRDLTPLLNEGSGFDEGRLLVWHYPHAWGASGPGITPHVSVRRGDWKLIHDYADGHTELYNLREDLSETTDLSKSEPDRLTELVSDLHAYMIGASARVPRSKETGLTVPLPGDEPGVRIACLGDSLTFGSGVADRDSESYPAQLALRLGPGFNVRNFGIGAATLLRSGQPTVWERLDSVRSFNPHACIIMVGANDSVGEPRGNWERIDRFVPDYHDLIDALRGVPAQPEVWLCATTPVEPEMPDMEEERRAFLREINPRLTDLRERVRRVAEERATRFLDLNAPLAGRLDLFTDGVHFTAEGYGVVADLVADALQPWLVEHGLTTASPPPYARD